jgi:predicted ATPase/transcriptional regulator with XRE-family HTH domain
METSFGNWVRRRRKALDLTQEDLAGHVGCSTSAIFKIEAGERRPSRQIAELLATHLKIPTDQRTLFIKIARMEKSVDSLGDLQRNDLPLLPPSTDIPLTSKPLVGREFELAEITRLIMQPQCRLLTLIGQGGIGKTHLVMVLADQIRRESHQHEVSFVNLAPVTGREQTVTAIATALGIVLYSASDRADQLIAYLRSRDLLLILDNFEHLSVEAGCIELISSMMRGTEKVKLMMTSREPLQLQAEWVFEVQGLPVPESSNPNELVFNSAEALFIQRAKQAEVSFQPTNEDLLAIAQICKLVEGLPLGIELAATWVRTLSCQGIVEEIQRSIHFLESVTHDLPERHRSIHATIEYSWKRLSSEEQKVLRELSIFRGGFRREAGERVAGARLPILSSLISKSLIRRTVAGRYDMHGLIQQYTWERLQEEDSANIQVWQRYSQYYASLLAQRRQALKGIERTAVVAELIEELPNLRQAWQWISKHQQAQEINQAADTLFWLYESRSNCREGVPLFDEAVQYLQIAKDGMDESNLTEQRLALGQALCYKGYFLYRQGQHPQGREAISSSLHILETHPVQQDEERLMAISNAKVFLGTITAVMGDFEEGDRLLREGLAMKQRLNDLWGAAFCLRQIGLFAFHYQGDYVQAFQTLHQSYVISKQLQNSWAIAASLSQLGRVSYAHGNYAQAEQYLTEALALSRMLEDRASIAFALDCLGPVKITQRLEEGLKLLEESISIWREIGEQGNLAQTLIHFGTALIKMGRPQEAQKPFHEALQIASEIQTMPVLLEALLGYAELQAVAGNIEKAFEVVTAVELNPSNSFEARSRAENLQTILAKKLVPHISQDIQTRSSSIKLADIVQTILSTDGIPGN